MAIENKPTVMLPYCIANVNKLKEIAEKQGFAVEILKHSGEVPGLLDKYQPQYGLGVVCTPEVEKLKKILNED